MGEHEVSTTGDEERHRTFLKGLLRDVQALESMIERGMIETGVRRIGAEQEMFFVDQACRPTRIALQVLEQLEDPRFTTELALYNLEANLDPRVFGGSCLSDMQVELESLVGAARQGARREHGDVLLTGILPTVTWENLGLDSMTPSPRYRALNDGMTALRKGRFRFHIKGVDELDTTHDNVMLESCNTSFQLHFQVAPAEFAPLYNLAQVVTGPVLAAAVNSPVLLGKRLWQETRVALFQQSIDGRSPVELARGQRPRVTFGNGWLETSVLDVFREDIARFRVVLRTELDEDPIAVVEDGRAPALRALRLHNGTIYRWNRACYGVNNGIAHLRIENRAIPAGPTIVDEIANAAFYYGLLAALTGDVSDLTSRMSFDSAKENFFAAARYGLKAQFTWLDGRQHSASDLILRELLPAARAGLRQADIDSADIDAYLGIVEERVRRGRTGAQWMLDSLAGMPKKMTGDLKARKLASKLLELQWGGGPVHTWELAAVDDEKDWRQSYLRVGQFMTTDLFTVAPDDVVDLAASLMDWRHIRHVPVEDSEGQLVGLVSHRSLLRLLSQGIPTEEGREIAIEEIMHKDPITVTADTPTLDAIELMRRRQVGCHPVVDDGVLVGIVSERDLMSVASMLLERYLRESTTE